MLKEKLIRMAYKTAKTIVHYAPEELAIAGVVSSGAAVVFAVKDAPKAESVIAEYKEEREKIEEAKKIGESNDNNVKYSKADYKKDLVALYLRTGIKMVSKLWRTVACWTISAVFTIRGARVSRNSINGLSATIVGLETAYKNYREKVKEKYGEEADQEIAYGYKLQNDNYTDEHGNKVERKTKSVNPLDGDPYGVADYFDESSEYWSSVREYNVTFIQGVVASLNLDLKHRGYMYLDEVKRRLGMKVTKKDHHIGWVYDDSKEGVKKFANHIEIMPMRITGNVASMLLAFNVDGYIDDEVHWG